MMKMLFDEPITRTPSFAFTRWEKAYYLVVVLGINPLGSTYEVDG